MAKYELPIYDKKTGESEKVLTRNFMPVDLFIRFQAYAEKLSSDEYKEKVTDEIMFDELQPLFCEMFPTMTKDEYKGQTDIAEVLSMFRDIVTKATTIKPSKNA